jgi:multidrug efflux pump subunit AcrA (membrane-fusion protein)
MKWWLVAPVVLLLITSLAGCSSTPSLSGTKVEAQGPGQDGPTLGAVQASDDGVVIVEGVVEPERSSYLSFELPGDVVEVRVKAGDRVETDDVLILLDARELDLALRSGEQDVIAQGAALRQLREGASQKVISRADKANADQIAQAEVALRAKQLQLEKARQEDPSIAVTAAQARVRQLELALAQAQAQGVGPSVTTAEVALERARIALTDTQDEYDQALDRPWEDQAIRDTWAKRLEQAQLDYKAAQAGLDNAQNAQRAHDQGLGVLAAQIEEARTQLAQALVSQDTFLTTIKILTQEVEASRLQLQALQTWDNPYRDAAPEQTIVQAEASLEKTRVALEQLRLQREDTTLTAPFAGTVVAVDVEPGDQVAPGQTVVTLATLSRLEVKTTDLSELEVGQIEVGEGAVVKVDAFPSSELRGTVTDIALQAQDYRGDTVYEVTIGLDPVSAWPALRWGMTAMVEIGGQ